jgi:hypothetical protein
MGLQFFCFSPRGPPTHFSRERARRARSLIGFPKVTHDKVESKCTANQPRDTTNISRLSMNGSCYCRGKYCTSFRRAQRRKRAQRFEGSRERAKTASRARAACRALRGITQLVVRMRVRAVKSPDDFFPCTFQRERERETERERERERERDRDRERETERERACVPFKQTSILYSPQNQLKANSIKMQCRMINTPTHTTPTPIHSRLPALAGLGLHDDALALLHRDIIRTGGVRLRLHPWHRRRHGVHHGIHRLLHLWRCCCCCCWCCR